jgi:mono/diheme cytochrome c family protein
VRLARWVVWGLAACGEEAPVGYGLGRPATAEEIAALDLDVDPSGRGRAAGRGAGAPGRAPDAPRCAACHGAEGQGGAAPLLVATGPGSGLADDYRLPRTIGNYWPYATTLYDYVRRAMPQNAPGSLTPDEVYAVVAFLLAENRAVPPDFVADAQTLPAVIMPTRVRFVPDDRAGGRMFR